MAMMGRATTPLLRDRPWHDIGVSVVIFSDHSAALVEGLAGNVLYRLWLDSRVHRPKMAGRRPNISQVIARLAFAPGSASQATYDLWERTQHSRRRCQLRDLIISRTVETYAANVLGTA